MWWKTILAGLGLFFIAYKLYQYKYVESSLISKILRIPFFLISRDIQVNGYILEIGHVGFLGSCLILKDKVIFYKLIKTINTIDKDGTISYHFDENITLTFLKNEEKKEVICKLERNGEVIEGDVTGFVKTYKPILFDTDFDLISNLN